MNPVDIRIYGNKDAEYATKKIAENHQHQRQRQMLATEREMSVLSTFLDAADRFHCSSPVPIYAEEAHKRTIYITNVDIIYNKKVLFASLS